mmetsp:Transcript_24873/g.48669  ORF Transcript_24873/g.48669 Transcript_24873/m.48669 type:complete len:241 (-) Transcript_24873:211-933(-)
MERAGGVEDQAHPEAAENRRCQTQRRHPPVGSPSNSFPRCDEPWVVLGELPELRGPRVAAAAAIVPQKSTQARGREGGLFGGGEVGKRQVDAARYGARRRGKQRGDARVGEGLDRAALAALLVVIIDGLHGVLVLGDEARGHEEREEGQATAQARGHRDAPDNETRDGARLTQCLPLQPPRRHSRRSGHAAARLAHPPRRRQVRSAQRPDECARPAEFLQHSHRAVLPSGWRRPHLRGGG